MLGARFVFLFFVGLLSFSLAWSAELPPERQAFRSFQTVLAGKWFFYEEENGVKTCFVSTILPTSKGAALMEINDGLTIVYHLDGDALALTLFTSEGTQIRMKTPALQADQTTFSFQFRDALNLRKNAPYMSGLDIIIKDANHVTQLWKMLMPGAQTSLDYPFELTRVTPSRPAPEGCIEFP